jgi:glutaminyl-tRNA synthetase
VRGTLHWVSAAHAIRAEVRLYGHLFREEFPGSGGRDFTDDLNPESLELLPECFVEPALAGAAVGEGVQFLRHGYFCLDPDSAPGRLVFNKTISLRDSWGKIQGKG